MFFLVCGRKTVAVYQEPLKPSSSKLTSTVAPSLNNSFAISFFLLIAAGQVSLLPIQRFSSERNSTEREYQIFEMKKEGFGCVCLSSQDFIIFYGLAPLKPITKPVVLFWTVVLHIFF